jgi:hypothetical protein
MAGVDEVLLRVAAELDPERHIECQGEPIELVELERSDPSFRATDQRPIKLRSTCEIRLRPATSHSQHPDDPAEVGSPFL